MEGPIWVARLMVVSLAFMVEIEPAHITGHARAFDSTAPTPIFRAQSQRDRILDAALEIFVERGFLGTTMDAIGEAVGMRAPSLYKHVRSKQELLAELMSRAMAELHRSVVAAVDSTDDAELRLRRVMEAHVRYHGQHRLDALLGTRELANLEPGPLRDRIFEEREQYTELFTHTVAEGIRTGDFAVDDAKLTALALLDVGKGLAVWFRADGELPLDELVYRYSDLAIRMVGGKSTIESPGGGDST